MTATGVHLRVQGVDFSYPRSAPLFSNLDLDLQAGQMTALTGRSGTGKSTLLYMLGLMVRPSRGQIALNGVATANLRDRERARMRAELYGFIFQDASLDGTRTVLENVVEAALYRGEDPRRYRQRAIRRLEDLGVEVPLHRSPGQVSGGQAQRIALCRALLHDPVVVLADEPTGNLDSESSAVVLQALRQQAERGAVVVVSTHASDARAACDAELAL